MAEGKKSVLLYCDLIHTIEKMDNETAGQFLHRFTYKSEASEQAALTQLQKMATNQERKAIEILHYTMANGWKGFVEPKTDPRKETQDAFQAVKDKINFDFSDGKLSFER
jgi:hypothetical protein